MQKLLSLLALTCLLAACSQTVSSDASVGATADADAHAAEDASHSSSTHIGLEWEFTQTRTGEYDEPFQEVNIILTGGMDETIALGEVSGTCAEKKQEEVMAMRKDHSGIVSAALCWWAGAGTEFIVRQTPENTLVVEKRAVAEEETDEGMGMAAEASVTVGTPLALPAEAEVMGSMIIGE